MCVCVCVFAVAHALVDSKFEGLEDDMYLEKLRIALEGIGVCMVE